ncbi:hypothetical protein PRIPAC_76161, partial [Pristionchus pacificus]
SLCDFYKMRKVQWTILFLNFLLTRQPKYRDCTRDRTEEKETFCVNYESLPSILIFAAIVLSAVLERCKFKTSTFGLLAANALFALLRMQNTNYIVLALLEEMLAVTSMVLHNLALISVLDRSSVRQKSVIIALHRIMQILSAQLPSLIFHSSYEARTGFRVAISLIDFASASCLAMAFLKNFSDNEYERVHKSEHAQEIQWPDSNESMLTKMLSIIRTLPTRAICLLILIGILCDPVIKIINNLDFEFSRSDNLEAMSAIWVATELIAVICFILNTWKFNSRTTLIVSMAVFTAITSVLGLLPIQLSEADLELIPSIRKYLFYAALLSATIINMTCIQIIATSIQQGIRCFVLTTFTASVYAFWPLFKKFLEISRQLMYPIVHSNMNSPNFYAMIAQNPSTVEMPFLHFAIVTLIIFIAAIFVPIRQQIDEEEVRPIEMIQSSNAPPPYRCN